jgi:anti-anti-sigma factor
MEGIAESEGAGMAFEIKTSDGGATAVVTISGELDVANIERLAFAVAPFVEAGPRRLIVDAGRLTFADSSAIALWVRWASLVDEFELRQATPLLRRILTSMGLDQRFGLQV